MDEHPIISANGDVNFSDIKNSPIAIGDDITQINTVINFPSEITNPNEQNITITSKDTILNEISDWIKAAKHLESVNNDFDEALKTYERAEGKLKTYPNNELLLKIIIGKSVCYHNKGNSNMANKLLHDAKKIDEVHPIVLANISSSLRVYGNIDEAEVYARKSLEYDQNCVLARTVLALIEYEKGESTEALRLLRETANIDQGDAYPVYSISYVYFKENKYDDAIKYGEKAVSLEKTTASYHRHLGDIFLGACSSKNVVYTNEDFHKQINKDYVLKSIQYFEKSIELNSLQDNEHLNADIYPNLASALLTNHEFEKSIECNEKAIECGVELDEICMNMGMAHIALGNYKKCIEYYEPLVDKGIDSFVVRANLAIAYITEKRYDEAELLLDILITKSPEHLDLHVYLAQVKDKKGEFQQGITILNKASKYISLNWQANHVLGKLYYKNEDYELTARHFKQAIEQDNEAIDPIRDLICLYLECQIPEYALKYAEDLVVLDSDNKSIHYHNIAVIYHNMGNNLKTIEYAQKALDFFYKDVMVYRLLCSSLATEGLIDEAKICFKEGLEAYPKDLKLNYNYAVFLTQIEDVDEAIDILNWLIGPSNNFTPAHIFLSDIYYSMGSDKKAIKHATKSILNEPDNEYAHFILGNTLLKMGRVDEAVDQFKIVRKINPNTKYVISAPVEHLFSIFDNQFEELQDAINDYENGYITLAKAAENAHLSISNILNYSNNRKVAECLNVPGAQLEQIENVRIAKKNAVIDISTLEILAQVGELKLLNLFFDNIYVTKEFENRISKNLYRAEEPYREIKTKLSISKNGWLKGLTPNNAHNQLLQKLLPADMFSGQEIDFISLAIDNDAIYLTEDLLARYIMKRFNISSCGIFGFLNSAIEKKLMTKEAGILIYKKLLENKYVSHFFDLK